VGHGSDGVPFIGDVAGVGDGPRATPRGGEAWGGGQRDGRAVRPAAAHLRRSRAVHVRAAHDRCRNKGGRGLIGGPPL
jgi:hypothetical protein